MITEINIKFAILIFRQWFPGIKFSNNWFINRIWFYPIVQHNENWKCIYFLLPNNMNRYIAVSLGLIKKLIVKICY